MTLQGWEQKYKEILKEFNYDIKKDIRSARILNMILKDEFPLKKLERKIKNKTVFVIGAGPSLDKIVPVLKEFRNITKIVADGTTRALVENKIKPDIVVTDGDGSVFLARYFGARKIILFGMDFGTTVGRYSKELDYDKRTKLRKLKKAKSLLEWLALKDGPEFYTTSVPIEGFSMIRFSDL